MAQGSSAASDLSANLPPPENKQYYPALDGLRAIAVLMVFATHYGNLPAAINWGNSGVDIFFVLSGLLITGILFDSQHRPDRYRVFYIRRTLRIFPLYYAVLFVAVLLFPIFRWQLHPAQGMWFVYLGNYSRLIWQSAVQNFTYTPYDSLYSTTFPAFRWELYHLWSLCVEEQFYLVWPFVVFAVARREQLLKLCLGVVMLVPFLRMLALHVATPDTIHLGLLYRAAPLRADALVLGGALALCLRGPERTRLLQMAKPVGVALLVIAAALEVKSRLRWGHWVDAEYARNHSAWLYTLLALLSAALILRVLQAGTWLHRVCLWPPLRWLGLRSYGFYVYHALLYHAWFELSVVLCFGHRGLAARVLPAVALGGTLVVCWASFRFFEAPILRLKARFA